MTHSLLNPDDKHDEAWLSIRSSLFNKNFNEYDKYRNLTESLLIILNRFSPTFGNYEQWQLWRTAVTNENKKLVTEKSPTAAQTGRKGSVERTGTGKFIIAACLVYQPNTPVLDQVLSLQALLLLSLMQFGYNKKSEDVATTVRRTSEDTVIRNEIYSKFPTLDGDISGYCSALILITRKLKKSEHSKTKRSEPLLKFLRDIEKLCKTILDSDIIQVTHPSKLQDNFHLDFDLENEAETTLGSITSTVEIDETFEPQIDFLWEERPHPKQESLPSNVPLTESKSSKHWLRGYYTRTAFDKNRLNPQEKRIVSKFIRKCLSSKSNLDKYAGIVLAIAYTSHYTIKECTEFASQEKSLPLTNSLDLRKEIILPEKAYTPPTSANTELIDQARYIDLPLHPSIKKTLQTLIYTSSMRLYIKPNPKLEELTEFISNNIHSLRNNGQYDISQNNINIAFKIEVTLNENNPITSFTLAGRKSEAPPVLGYYAAPTLQRMINAYESTIHGLLSVKA